MNYEEMFRERGSAYAHAMVTWPEARREDFVLPVELAALEAGDIVVDVPAGGGDLRRYLPITSRWHGHEPCASFLSAGALPDQPLLPLPWADAFADVAISIAGMHHLEDRLPLFREIRRVLKPGGRFVLADVHVGSPVARFLDDFVGRHNSTGHRGNYMSADEIPRLQASGLRVDGAERLTYRWWFDDRTQMAEFCRLLFDIRELPLAAVAAGIEDVLGVSSEGGRVGMRWELYALTGSRAESRAERAGR